MTIKILMLSIGDEPLRGAEKTSVKRHLDYCGIIDAEIHMVTLALSSSRLAPMNYEDRFFVYPTNSFSKWTYPLSAVRSAYALARKHKFDLVYCQDPFGTALVGYVLKKLCGLPLVIGNHSSFIDNEFWMNYRPILNRAINAIAKFLLRRADKCRVINHSEKQKYIDRLNIKSKDIHVCNVPVPLDNFSADIPEEKLSALREKLGLKIDNTVFIWAGRAVACKKLNVLLQAFKIVSDKFDSARLLLVGDCRKSPLGIPNQITSLNLDGRVLLTEDAVSYDELPAYYSVAHAYVHASAMEGFGKVFLEAQAAGLPVVSTATDGAGEIIKNEETGFLVPLDDVKAMAEKMLWLCNNAKARKQIGKNGKQRIGENFTYRKGIERIAKLWHEAAGI